MKVTKAMLLFGPVIALADYEKLVKRKAYMGSFKIFSQTLAVSMMLSVSAHGDLRSTFSKIRDKAKEVRDNLVDAATNQTSSDGYDRKVIAFYTDEHGRTINIYNKDVPKIVCDDWHNEKETLRSNRAQSFYFECKITNELTGRSINYHSTLIGPKYQLTPTSAKSLSPALDVTEIFEPFQRADSFDTYYNFTPWDNGSTKSYCKKLNIHKMTKEVDPTNPNNVALTQSPLHPYIKTCDEGLFKPDEIVTKKVQMDFQDDQTQKHAVYGLLNTPEIIQQMNRFLENPLGLDKAAREAYEQKGATQEAAEEWELKRVGLTHIQDFSISYECRTIPLSFFTIK